MKCISFRKYICNPDKLFISEPFSEKSLPWCGFCNHRKYAAAGQMISMAFATLVLNAFLGESKIIPGNHFLFITDSQIIFAVFALLYAMGVFASLARGKIIK